MPVSLSKDILMFWHVFEKPLMLVVPIIDYDT
jgi:hypothetical protein